MTALRISPLIYVTVFDTAGNSQRITEQSHRVKALHYTDSEAKADKLSLTVDNFDLSNFDDQIWAHGNRMEVSWGYPGNMALTRSVIITKVTGFTELKVEGRARSVLMDTVPRSVTFDNMTKSEVVRSIAELNGYSANFATIQDTPTRFSHITQPKITDAQMLRRLARQQGYEFYVDQTGFHWHERNLLQKTARSFVWYTDAGRGDVLKINVESDITRRPAQVTTVAHDPTTGNTTTSKASDTADSSREGLAEVLIFKSEDLRSGYTAAQSYQPITEKPASRPEDAAEEAKAAFRRSQRAMVKLTLEAVGDPTMLAKSVCHLSGVGAALTGRYYVKEVVHNVTAGSYHMTCKMVSDGTGPKSKRQHNVNENGLPEVTPNSSRAKKAPPDAPTQDIRGPTYDPNNPGKLVPVVRLGADGNLPIATEWEDPSAAGGK